MNKKHLGLFFACLAFVCADVKAQSPANVDPLTGAVNVNIPIYTVRSGPLSMPVSLVYAGSGIKVMDVEGTAGMGWNLQAGGQITRVLRGLPDDCLQDISSNTRLGWMSSSNSAPSLISSFSIQNNGSTCSYETNDLSYISSYFPVTLDTEPDLFYVNAPGLSCELVYDKSILGFRPVNYQDIKISYTTSTSGGALYGSITSFTITNDKGVQYQFAAPETAEILTTGSSPAFFTTQFNQYQGGIQYIDRWCLTAITDPQGNGFVLNYSTGAYRGATNPVDLYIGGSSTKTNEYNLESYVQPLTLTFIETNDGDLIRGTLAFGWIANPISGGGTDKTFISTITGMGHSWAATYSSVKYVTSGGGNYYRQFLRTFADGTDPNSPVNYYFRYYGESGLSTFTTVLPDSSSHKIDYWGYYNSGSFSSLLPQVWVNPSSSSYPTYQIYQSSTSGSSYSYSLSGNIRTVDTANVKAGSLESIQLAQGGVTTINYESNTFYDPQAGQVEPGGGVRVHYIVDDPVATGEPYMVRYYSYDDPSTSATSGKPVSLPQYAFTIPYSGSATGATLWADCTALSTTDLSNEDHTIMYGYCREKRYGAGSTLYQFYNPSTNWDNSGTPGCNSCSTADWAPTIDLIGRGSCSSSYGPIRNSLYGFPFIPNTNYDFERGLLQKVTKFRDDGTTKVSESTYTYQRSFTPTSITGFKYDGNTANSLTATGYAKYTIYCSTGELTSTVTNKVYDSNAYTQSRSTTTSYTYGSSYHKLPTATSITNSDGSVYTSNTTYVKDYTSVGSGTNANVTALYNMQLINNNAPVETYTQVTQSSTTKTTGGSLMLYKAFSGLSGTYYLPSQSLKFVAPDGLPSFTAYSASGSGGSQTSSYDSHYTPVRNFTEYDFSGYPQTTDDNNHHVSSMMTDHNTFMPTLSIKNAAYSEVGFNDFDSYPSTNFAVSGSGSFSPTGSHTGSAYGMGTGQTFTATVAKNAIAQNYVFSIWINVSSGSKTIYLSLNGGTATAYTFTGTGGWKYYEWKVPVSSMPSSFTVAMTTAQSISIDDLLFYPDVAEVTTIAYDPTSFFKTAQTNTNGVSSYFTNDQWGRITYVRDQDHNIVQRNTYVIPSGL